MIPVVRRFPLRFLAPLLVCVACQAPSVNSVQRAAATREVEGLRGERALLQRERVRLELGLAEDQAALGELRRRAAASAAQVAAEVVRLDQELDRLAALEEDLAAARARAVAAEAELQPLRTLAAEAAELAVRLTAATARREELAREVAAAEAALATAQAEAAARLAELARAAAAVQRLDSALGAAMRAVGEALGPLLPRPPSPAAAPQGAPTDPGDGR